jgi:hypothetical protein
VVVVAAPDRQIAAGADLFDKTELNQLGDEFLGGSAL